VTWVVKGVEDCTESRTPFYFQSWIGFVSDRNRKKKFKDHQNGVGQNQGFKNNPAQFQLASTMGTRGLRYNVSDMVKGGGGGGFPKGERITRERTLWKETHSSPIQ